MIREIHEQYCAAGADILETNTFNATRIAMADYEMEDLSAEINREAARLARAVADEWTAKRSRQAALRGRGLGPDQPHRLHLAGRQRSRQAQRHL